MKVTDTIFALIAGRIVGLIVSDFLREWGIPVGVYERLVIWLIFPLLSLFCLWLAYKIGQKILFVFQAAKHLLVGAAATVLDLKLFEFLFWLPAMLLVNPVMVKGISFLFSTSLKYWGNKYWAFQKPEKEHLKKEFTQFFIITLIGLIIDISVFYYATKVAGPQFGLPEAIWMKLSIIA